MVLPLAPPPLAPVLISEFCCLVGMRQIRISHSSQGGMTCCRPRNLRDGTAVFGTYTMSPWSASNTCIPSMLYRILSEQDEPELGAFRMEMAALGEGRRRNALCRG